MSGTTHILRRGTGLAWVMMRAPAPGVVRTLFYPPAFFGKKMSALTQEVMRGRSAWVGR